jgi:hypothetical protein
MSLVYKREYLYNNNGSHDKVYNIVIKDERVHSTCKYTVVAEWGARLGVLKTQVKYEGYDVREAEKVFAKLKAEKIQKSYRVVNQRVSNKTTITSKLKEEVKPSQSSAYTEDRLLEEL